MSKNNNQLNKKCDDMSRYFKAFDNIIDLTQMNGSDKFIRVGENSS